MYELGYMCAKVWKMVVYL